MRLYRVYFYRVLHHDNSDQIFSTTERFLIDETSVFRDKMEGVTLTFSLCLALKNFQQIG